MNDIRVIPSAALTTTLAALIAFVLQHPHAAMWTAVAALVLAVLSLFTLAGESIGLRADLDDAGRRAWDLEHEITERDERIASRDDIIARLEDDNMRMAAELAARGSNVVPFQRSGDHDALPESGEVSDYAWPRIARRIEDIQAWGQDADQ